MGNNRAVAVTVVVASAVAVAVAVAVVVSSCPLRKRGAKTANASTAGAEMSAKTAGGPASASTASQICLPRLFSGV